MTVSAPTRPPSAHLRRYALSSSSPQHVQCRSSVLRNARNGVGRYRRRHLLRRDVRHPVAEVVAAEPERDALEEGRPVAGAGPVEQHRAVLRARPVGRCRRRARPACRNPPRGRRRARASSCREVGVISAYRLFWHTNTSGRSHSAAMFAASWNEPVLVAPSPKLTAVTRSSPLRLAAIASPTATGGPGPDDPGRKHHAHSGLAMCMVPPLPRPAPTVRPIISP